MRRAPRFPVQQAGRTVPFGRRAAVGTQRRRARRGMSLLEVMVTIAILLAVVGTMSYAIGRVLGLQQRQAARELTALYSQLIDEAVMMNTSFRIAFNLTQGTYKVDVGEGNALVFTNAAAREQYEEDEARRVSSMSEEEQREHAKLRRPFKRIGERFEKPLELPSNTVFAAVYTPQYDELIERELPEDRDPDDGDQIVYAHIFSSGFAEHAVIWLAEAGQGDDPVDGWTVEVEPLAGEVRLHAELLDARDSMDFVPEEGPDLAE